MRKNTYTYEDHWTCFKIKVLSQIEYFKPYIILRAIRCGKQDKEAFENAFYKSVAFKL